MNVFSQEKSNREIKGDKYYTVYSFEKAIRLYTRVSQLSLDGQRRLAESYYNIGLKDKSEQIYSEILSSSGRLLDEDYYNYSKVLRSNGKYYESEMWMNKFSELRPDDIRVKDYLLNKDAFNNLLMDQGYYKIAALKINSEALDFGTSYYNDKIVYASTNESGKLISRKYNWTGKPFWDLYVSEIENGQLNKPGRFDRKLNDKLHDGPASFSKKGTYMAITRNHYNDKSKDKVVELQIHFCDLVDGNWSKPLPFYLNNEGYSVGQPCLTEDGNTMYFTSDMPGGYGKTDIYKISKDNSGEWGKPFNLGENVNTEGDEVFPFFEESRNILFFSSNGRLGLGGLDLFVSYSNKDKYSRAYNVGFPLNTRDDDFAAIVDFKKNNGYFSSDRSGGEGGDDLYAFTFKGFPKEEIQEADVMFSVISPKNMPLLFNMRETFPLRNYIYFQEGSNEIPNHYVKLTKDQAKIFKEEKLEEFSNKDLAGRSGRQMIAYYNILNILGDRMIKNKSSEIILVGSSLKGPQEGASMAEKVKRYLVDIFNIKPERIGIEGREKPKIPSEQPGGIIDLEMLREGDRRVSIESRSPEMLMEFQSGPSAPLRPVEMKKSNEASNENNVIFIVKGASEVLKNWSMDIVDENGFSKSFGPFYKDEVSIPGNTILGNKESGTYKIYMKGLSKNGNKIQKEATTSILLWSPPVDQEGMRFSIIFEFDDSRAISIYENYLTEIVVPKIPNNGKVIIHGHTDITGDETHNMNLSSQRAQEAASIIKKGLANINRSNVKVESFSFGENQESSPFENDSPEGRAYNRTVIIDIIPGK